MLLQSADSAFWLFYHLGKNTAVQLKRIVQEDTAKKRSNVFLKHPKNYLASLSLVITKSELILKKIISEKNSFQDHNAILNSFPNSINSDL